MRRFAIGLCTSALAAAAPAAGAADVLDPQGFSRHIEAQAFESASRHHEQQYRLSQAELNTFLRGDSLTDDEWKFSRSMAREFTRVQRVKQDESELFDGEISLRWDRRRNLASRIKAGYRDGTRSAVSKVVGERIGENIKIDVVGRPKIQYKIRF